jgi:hypothetical protein
MSWALSCLQATRFYDKVELVTDQIGKEILIDQLHLPYSKVCLELDSIQHYRADFWCLGKLHAYSIQNDPFLHIDSDVYIWKRFPKAIENARIAVQNIEKGYEFYQALFEKISSLLSYVPGLILEYKKTNDRFDAYNMGVVGGTELNIFKQFKEMAFEFINRNITQFDQMPVGLFNTFLEQVLFLCLTCKEKIDVQLLIKIKNRKKIIRETQSFPNFANAARHKKFIHLYGYCKQNEKYCLELEKKLKNDYHPYYKRIKELQPLHYAAYHYI